MGAYNERLVLSIIRRQGALSKAELAKRTGLSRQTLTDVVGRLEAEGRLRREELVRGRVGQPQVPFSLNPSGAYTVGLKVGRKSFEFAVMNFVGSTVMLFREMFLYPDAAALENFFIDSWSRLQEDLPSNIIEKIVGVGIAMPGELWRWTDEIDVPPEFLERWKTFDVAEFVESITAMRTWVMNDVTSACIGELMFGDLPSKGDFAYFHVGAFVGGGLVIDDGVMLGNRLNAAAFGSMLVADDGEQGAEPSQLLSSVSLIRLQRQLESEGERADFIWRNDVDWPEFSSIFEDWLAQAARNLAVSALNVVAVVDVPQVVIDGSLPSSVRDRLVDATGRAMAGLKTSGLSIPTLVAGTLGYNARIVGAAALPLYSSLGYDRGALLKD